ncbi:hypothetical protein NQ314_018873 [Rhamnusium bicolor]|uniref:DDE Tnp4 domain-containing protein n=1 Tax=Rhamnusium bicolor TaxID=1586634 RepID=A0AAV8WS13_9CUCU|nr:hypothetical protein NQ314_018873 [Rhamnusium bicolor]
MKPYPKKQVLEDSNKAVFNYRLSRARRVTENAVGIVCYTFFTPINIKTSTVDLIVLACCLHNLLRDEYVLNHRRKTNLEENLLFPTENMIPIKGIGGFACAEGFQVRSRFTDYVARKGAVKWLAGKI